MLKHCKSIGLTTSTTLFVLLMMASVAFAQEVPVGGADAATAGDGETLGGVIDSVRVNTFGLAGVLSGFSYLAGLVFGFMAVMKTKDHVENPNQTPIWDPMKRTLASGAFFSMPFLIQKLIETVAGSTSTDGYAGSKFEGKSSGAGLDGMIVKLMSDIFVPSQWLFGWFGYIAGIMLVLIGISRLLKTEQEGPRGPTGIGTIMTFIVAGCLFSLNSMIGFFSETLFETGTLKNNGVLRYTDGLAGAEAHVHAVISAIVAFSIVVGWISLIRGFFILRGVSEGNSQASMMAAITHLIGGVMAINLGSIINAVQNTLGISNYGINFT